MLAEWPEANYFTPPLNRVIYEVGIMGAPYDMRCSYSDQHSAEVMGEKRGAELGLLQWKTVKRRFLKTEESRVTSERMMSSVQEQPWAILPPSGAVFSAGSG